MGEVLYRDRPEWSNIVPIPQNEPNANPIAPIFYTDAYKDATDYFRGVVKIREMSERVLGLTESIIRMNPAHYSAWQYRYQTLISINAPLDEELELMDELAELFLKNYQVWHHRRLLILRGALSPTKSPATELAFIARGLHADAKNYHTWAYRQFILTQFNSDELWAKEIAYVENMLEDDVRNNSVWNHRFFVVFASGVRKGEEDRDDVVRRELAFAKEKIALAPNNMSAWNYLRGVLEHAKMPYETVKYFVIPYTEPRETSTKGKDDVVDLENPRPTLGADLPSPIAMEFLADIYEEKGDDALPKAVDIWLSLANEHDIIRKKYWQHRIMQAQLGS